MARIILEHARSDNAGVHIFRNFGEDVWREFQDERRIEVSLEEIDRCVDRFELRMKPVFMPRVLKRLRPILRKHLLEEQCAVIVED